MGSALSRIDDNSLSALSQSYTKDTSFTRPHKAKKITRRVSKSMIGKPSNFKHTHHIGSGDYQDNHAGVQEQIAEITVIFNATNKPSAITRKPVGEKFGSPKTISKQNKSSGRTPNAIRKQLVRKEPSKKVFSQAMLMPSGEPKYISKTTANSPLVRRTGLLESMSCSSLQPTKASLYSFAEKQRHLGMMKEDLVRMSRSEYNLRKYAACNNLLQLAPSRESFVC